MILVLARRFEELLIFSCEALHRRRPAQAFHQAVDVALTAPVHRGFSILAAMDRCEGGVGERLAYGR